MKKIISILALAILCCSLAFASNQNTENQQEKVQQMSQVTGLENAMLRVRTQERVEHLNQVMYKIQTHRREMLNSLDNLEIIEDENDEVTATGKSEGRLFWGLIPIQRRLKYEIDNEGNVERVRRWHELLWKKNLEID